MGTRGFIIWRYKGLYYAYYNHWDSYPGFLGKLLIDMVPQDEEELRVWIEEQRIKFASKAEVWHSRNMCVSDEDLEKLTWDARSFLGSLEPQHQGLMDERLSAPSFETPGNDMGIEWTYTIDLDEELFEVNSQLLRPLSDMPSVQEINRFFAKDYEMPEQEYSEITHTINAAGGPRKGINDFLDRVQKTSRPYQQIIKNGVWILSPTTSTTKSIRPVPLQSTLPRTLPQQCHASQEFRVVKAKGYDSIPDDRHGITVWYRTLFIEFMDRRNPDVDFSEGFAFRESAWAILSLASGLYGGISLLGEDRVKRPVAEDWVGAVRGDDPSGFVDLISHHGTESYKKGSQPGCAPEKTTYVLHNVLIHLVLDLGSSLTQQEAIMEAIQKSSVFETLGSTFNAIVMSPEHIVIARISPDRIDNTVAMSLTNSTRNQTDGQDDAFLAMAHVFRASAERLPHKRLQANLPIELLHQVLDLVDDRNTWLSCLQVCRHFQHYLLNQPFISQHLKLQGYKAIHIQTGAEVGLYAKTTSSWRVYVLCEAQNPSGYCNQPPRLSFLLKRPMDVAISDVTWNTSDLPVKDLPNTISRVSAAVGVKAMYLQSGWAGLTIKFGRCTQDTHIGLDANPHRPLYNQRDLWNQIFRESSQGSDAAHQLFLTPDDHASIMALPDHCMEAYIDVIVKNIHGEYHHDKIVTLLTGRATALRDTEATFDLMRKIGLERCKKNLEGRVKDVRYLFLSIHNSLEIWRYHVPTEMFQQSNPGRRLDILNSEDSLIIEETIAGIAAFVHGFNMRKRDNA